MALKKGDFIEIEFTGKVKEGEIFDSNVKSNLEKANIKGDTKPFVFCLGQRMFLEGIDNFLIGKEVGEYDIPVKPEEAFGKRNPKLIQMIPIKTFIQNRLNPIPGSMFNFDGKLAKILTVSGGRVMVDFNNPVAGKDLIYNVKILKKVEEQKEKINALNDFFFRKELNFKIENKKLVLDVPKGTKQFVEMFKEKYKEILGLEIEANEVEEIKKE